MKWIKQTYRIIIELMQLYRSSIVHGIVNVHYLHVVILQSLSCTFPEKTVNTGNATTLQNK